MYLPLEYMKHYSVLTELYCSKEYSNCEPEVLLEMIADADWGNSNYSGPNKERYIHTYNMCEMKNKHNTMNSASSAKTYIKMQSQILDDDCACLLVEAIAKRSQNIKWTTKVDGKNVQHCLIRRVSMDQFYPIVTGDENAFYKMCMALPEVINTVVNEEGAVTVPQDTVIQELRKVAELYAEQPENLAMAMSVYMLGFNTYLGFCQQEKEPFAGASEAMLKRIYEYAKYFV